LARIMATIALLRRYGSKLAYDTKIGLNSIGFFAGKFLPWLVFWFMLRVVFGIRYAAGRFCDRFKGGLCG